MARLCSLAASFRGDMRLTMLDLVYLGVGVGVLALFAGYAIALRRL